MIIATIFTGLFAMICARDDAKQIAQHSKIRHGLQWLFRAALVTGVCYLTAKWWLAFAMAGFFSAVFRAELNDLRLLDWRYISPSSWYDWQFIRLTHAGYDGQRDDAIEWHGRRYRELPGYFEDIHRAGTMAYIFEAVVFVFGLIIYSVYA